jgi:hypothetical protein
MSPDKSDSLPDTQSGSPLAPVGLRTGLLSPTEPGDIQNIQDALRATLDKSSPGQSLVIAPLRSPLREIDPTGLAAKVDWHISLRTLGSDRGFRFETIEVSGHAIHVRCADFDRTFFRPGATIVQVHLFVPNALRGTNGTPVDYSTLTFLGKIVKEVPRAAVQKPIEAGFLLHVIQMDQNEATKLTDILARLQGEAQELMI